MKKKAVLFDLDGTLVNSLPDISKCMNTALQKHGLPAHPQQAYCYMTGNGARVLTERAVGEAHQGLVDGVLNDYRALYAVHCYDSSFVYPGIVDMLAGLRAAGYKLAVLSNKDDPDVASVIAHYFAPNTFDVLRGRRDGVPLKPDPTAALDVARGLGIAPDDFWYLGDTATDCETCQAAGMHMIAVSWGFRPESELRQAGAARIVAEPAQALALMTE